MARMHSRRRGVSSSKKPVKKQSPSWTRYKEKEIEMLVMKFAKEGMTASKIGTILRDTYGIPDVRLICSKKITQIMKEKKVSKELPEDLSAMIKKAVMLRKHLEENRKDYTAKRGLQLTESKVKRLIKYYKKSGKLDEDWKYDPERAGFFIE